jgi:hypothetical protein
MLIYHISAHIISISTYPRPPKTIFPDIMAVKQIKTAGSGQTFALIVSGSQRMTVEQLLRDNPIVT